MKITWYGQAAFKLTGADKSVITDPYSPELMGYSGFRDTADIVLTSSDDDEGHCRSDLIPGSPAIANVMDFADGGRGSGSIGGLQVEAMPAEEWEHHPRGVANQNAMYRFELDGMKIAHMGDVGNALDEDQIAFFEDVDILLALAGGPPTIALPDLMEMIHRTRPRLVIPMHFRTLGCRITRMHWVQSFLDGFREDRVDFAFSPHATITKSDLPDRTRVLVLDRLQ
ncbi:MBL fold metallo-hydrolase [Jannaschia sp. 2305UL9-9]|uniref:MBL fold metallo-hydrolase n=1 Tax=Jannaschia sp. 2305UL9-9 TaxID=3121638 RepID=UPI0035281726